MEWVIYKFVCTSEWLLWQEYRMDERIRSEDQDDIAKHI